MAFPNLGLFRVPKAAGLTTSICDFMHRGRSHSTYMILPQRTKGIKIFQALWDIVCLGTVYNARTYPRVKCFDKFSGEHMVRIVEGSTKLYLQLNEPVPYKVKVADVDGVGYFEIPVSTLDGWENQNKMDETLVDDETLGYVG